MATALACALDIRLSVSPHWSKADAIAVLAKAAAAVAFARREFSEDVGIVASELVENAVKYGHWSNGAHLAFSLTSGHDHLQIDVSSPCEPQSTHYERLVTSLRQIERANARDSYLARLVKLADDRSERGGLGLLRLAHEAKCVFQVELAEGRLHVRAELKLPE